MVMIMIRITKVEFENYRQYKSFVISFPKGEDNNLHVLRAKNGTGKTTFLNGILWCLYGNEPNLNDREKALPIVNSALVKRSSLKDELKVTVRLTLNDDIDTIVFERTQLFFVGENPLDHVKRAVEGTSKLKVIQTEIGDISNSVVFEEETDVQSMVKQYFDEAIYDYYFFDGENLKSYFVQGKAERIRTSIFNISQVTLLKNASTHVRTVADEKYRAAAKLDKNQQTDLIDRIRKLEKDVEDLTDQNADLERQKPDLRRVIAEAEEALRGYSPIRVNIERRDSLSKKLKDLETEQDSYNSEKNSFITKYLTLLNFYPRAKHAYDVIVEKEQCGNLPPNIDKEQVERLLNEHAKNCPVCNGDLDEKAINHLTSLLKELDVSSATSNFLMEIKGGLETVVSECKGFPKEYRKILDKGKKLEESIGETRNALDDISRFLSKYSDGSSSFDVKKKEQERKHAQDALNSLEIRIGVNERDIKRYREELAELNAEKDKIEEKKQKKDHLSKQVALFRRLSSRYDEIQKVIMDEIKEDIQKQTWERFASMIWKKNTFGRIAINDKYELTVYDMDDNPMTGSLSATEYMALAYSFTLAIHDASGKNCPLVVDSPLGRVSDSNREKMAGELLKVAREKQIIMLFTPDEYSAEVRNLYAGQAASIREIALSENEEQIESIGD